MNDFYKSIITKLNPSIISCTYHDLTNKPWDNKLNNLNHNIFYYILDGEGQINVSGKDYFPTKNSLVIIPCHQYHFARAINDNHYKKISCYFYSKVGEYDLFDILSTPICVKIKDDTEIINVLNSLIELLRKQNSSICDELRIKELLIKLICIYFDNCEKNEIHIAKDKHNNNIENILKYIDDNIYGIIDVRTLAEISNFHPNYFQRLFKKTTGVSPAKYISNLRLNKMTDMLIYSDMHISEIAQSFHLSNKSFSAVIKKHYGVSPSVFRELNKSNTSTSGEL